MVQNGTVSHEKKEEHCIGTAYHAISDRGNHCDFLLSDHSIGKTASI